MLEISISFVLAGAAAAAIAVISRSLGEGVVHARRLAAELELSLGDAAG